MRRVVVGLLIAAILPLLVTGALGAQWTDLDDATLARYGIAAAEVGAISQGFPDGSWRPWDPMPRRQFVRLALRLFELEGHTPANPTFSDVPAAHSYYSDIEGAVRAGLVQGVGGGRFAPDQIVSREQGVAVVARRLAAVLQVDLVQVYPPSRQALALAPFADADQISPVLRPELAFAVEQGVLRGNDQGQLRPRAELARIQGAALLIRAKPLLPPGTTTTSAPATTTTTAPATTTTTAPATTTTTAPVTPAIFGTVLGRDGRALSGASVVVELTGSGGQGRVGQGVADHQGFYSIPLTGVTLGTQLDVIAAAPGYLSIFVFGIYDEVRERVDFVDFGSAGGDRRLPLDTGGIPPLPYSGLLPD
jgi:hypothetical protein